MPRRDPGDRPHGPAPGWVRPAPASPVARSGDPGRDARRRARTAPGRLPGSFPMRTGLLLADPEGLVFEPRPGTPPTRRLAPRLLQVVCGRMLYEACTAGRTAAPSVPLSVIPKRWKIDLRLPPGRSPLPSCGGRSRMGAVRAEWPRVRKVRGRSVPDPVAGTAGTGTRAGRPAARLGGRPVGEGPGGGLGAGRSGQPWPPRPSPHVEVWGLDCCGGGERVCAWTPAGGWARGWAGRGWLSEGAASGGGDRARSLGCSVFSTRAGVVQTVPRCPAMRCTWDDVKAEAEDRLVTRPLPRAG